MYTIEDAINDDARLGSLLMSERIPLQAELALLRRKAAALDWLTWRRTYPNWQEDDGRIVHELSDEPLLSSIEKAKEASGE